MPIEFNCKFEDNIWFAGVDNGNEESLEEEEYIESDEENEMLQDEIMKEINTYEPYQTKNYQTNEIDERELEINDIQEYENDHKEIINEEQNKLDLYVH